jgi:hypothetical protein
MIGGEDSFGAGGYQGTPAERLLPVDMEIKQRKVLPNGALAMVVHSCELSNGNFWANQVIQQAIRILSPRDYAGVLYFDYSGQDKWLFPLTLVSQRQMMVSRLNNFNPGDMPSFEGIVAGGGARRAEDRIDQAHDILAERPTMPTGATLDLITCAYRSRRLLRRFTAACRGNAGPRPARRRKILLPPEPRSQPRSSFARPPRCRSPDLGGRSS